MSLQKQITLILLVVITLFAGLDQAVQRFIVFPRYREIDQRNAEQEMKRGLAALEREIQNLEHLGQDWAKREDLAAIVSLGRITPTKAAQLSAELSASHLDFCYLFDRNGAVIWSNLPGSRRSGMLEAMFPGVSGQAGQVATNGTSPPIRNSAGLLRADAGVMVVATHGVPGTLGSREVVGTCLVGYLLNDQRLLDMSRQTGIVLQARACDCKPSHDHLIKPCLNNSCGFEGGEIFTDAEVAALAAGGSERPVLLRKLAGDRLQCLAGLPDFFGRHTILVKGVVPMTITAMGRDVLNGALIALVTAGLLIVMVLLEAIKVSVLKPITLLTNHAVSLRSNQSYVGHISGVLRSRNELGVLAREFDSMVERLARARRQLVEQSYYSGMTEVASRVMHSLRNALTPITAHLDLLREEFRDLPVEQIKMAGLELSGGEASPERREMLARYLRDSLDYMAAVMGDAAVRLKGMDSAVAAIEKILAEQEKFSGRDRRREPVELDALLREAGALLSLNYYRSLKLVSDPSLAEVGPVAGRRHALLHIFTNLLSNAIEAILRSGRPDGRIEVRAAIDAADDPGMVHVTFSDNGCGIAPEDMSRIFERGYTTKDQDSSGVGLHWCANTIATMHGRLYAESAGPGCGAVMHLLIPHGAVVRKDVVQ